MRTPLITLAAYSPYSYETLKQTARIWGIGILISNRRFLTKKEFSQLCTIMEKKRTNGKPGKKIKFYEKNT
jgi:hypothetical protein